MRGFSQTSAALLLKLLCNQNPFYLISALLVLFGLRQVTLTGAELTGGWLLMGVICSYTLLLAAAALIIIRFARVWDDARMILLVLVLLFLALSVSFDKVVLSHPFAGAQLLLVGFCFALALSEGLLRVLGLRLPAMYRGPYYLLLGVLFVYPLVLGCLSYAGLNEDLAWGVYLFPWISAAAMLTLLPAARRGHRQESPSGTPWQWPLYPWTLFIFLWVCFALRTYSLTFAFEGPAGWHVPFQFHLLAPLILAAAWLLLEIGSAAGSRVTQRVAYGLAVSVLPLALVYLGGKSDARFPSIASETIGGPVQIVCWALVVFFAIASLRRFSLAQVGLVVTMLLCSVVSRHTVSITTFTWPQPLAIDAAALVMVVAGIAQRRRWQAIGGGALVVVSTTLRDSSLAFEMIRLHSGFYTLHVVILAVLVVALVSNDRLSRIVRSFGCFFIPAAAWLAGLTYSHLFPEVDAGVQLLYLAALSLIAWAYWNRQRETPQLAGAMVTSLAAGAAPLKRIYGLLQATILAKALPWIVVGLVLLLVAVLISFYKGGLLRRIWPALRELNRRLRQLPSG